MPDFSILGDLGKTYQEAHSRRTLADLGKGLADGSIDYKKAAGLAAQAGRLDLTLGLIKMGGEEEASRQFQQMFGQPAQPTLANLGQSPVMASAPAMNAGPPVNTPRTPVQPTDKVWGDKEAEDAGLYEKPSFPQRFAGAEPLSPLDNSTGAPPPARAAFAQAPSPAPAPQAAPQAPQQQAATEDGLNLSPRLRQLIGAASHPRLPAAQKEIAKVLLTRELDNSKLPDPVKKYLFAKGQGFTGSLVDFETQLRKAGATNVTVGGGKFGTIPPGYELVEGPNGATMRPIPGGPAAREAAEKEEKDSLRKQQQQKYTDIVTSDVDRAIDKISSAEFPVTGLGSMVSPVPGTPAHDLSNLLNTIKANVGFDRLQELRATSPTGGALGPVSDFENKLLQATIGSVEQSQSKEQLTFNLKRLKNVYLDTVHGPGLGPSRESLATPPAAQQQPSGAAIKDGMTATNPQTGAKLIRKNGKWIPASGT